MIRVPAASRALAALLLAGSAVLGTSPAAASASVLPPDPPAVLVVGAGAALPDGKTILLDGTLNGSGVLDFFAPPGAGEAPVSWVLETTPPADGGPQTFETPGWSLPIGDTLGMSAPVVWSANAAPVSIDVRARGADGAYSEPTTLILRTDATVPAVANLQASVSAGAISLAWDESSTAPVATREVLTQTAPATTNGCGDWSAPMAVALPPSSAAGNAAGMAPPSSVSAVSSVIPSTAGEPVAPEAPTISANGPTSSGQVSLGAATAATCYRFTLRVHDALGRAGGATSGDLQVAASTPVVGSFAPGPWKGSVNLYRAGTFISQATPTWCVGASAQMMINLVSTQPDTTVAAQRAIMKWAQAHDGETAGRSATNRGTDAAGWISALDHFGAGHYEAVSAATIGDALRAAATAIRKTGRPVGLFAMGGQHAWVMMGFTATADPLGDDPWKVSSARVSGPLYPYTDKAGYDPAPNTSLTVSKLAKYFKPAFGTKNWMLIIPVDTLVSTLPRRLG